VKIFQEPSGHFSAIANQSASGSLAIMKLDPSQSAAAIASFKAPAPSSGLGNGTVEKSGSTSIYSNVMLRGGNPKAANDQTTNGVPTPCIAVYVILGDYEFSSLVLNRYL